MPSTKEKSDDLNLKLVIVRMIIIIKIVVNN